MQIGTKLLNEIQVGRFSNLNRDIQETQERISSGKKILRASDTPVEAVKLSAAKEQSRLIEQFQKNVDAASVNLNMTDQTLQEAVNVLIRMSELGTMARNGALDAAGHLAISTEMKELQAVVVGLANTTDANGIGIFGGFSGSPRPFEVLPNGEVEYLGSRGQNRIQISENMLMSTNIDGGSAFMRVDVGEEDRQTVFEIMKAAIDAVETAASIVPEVSANWSAKVDFELPSRMAEWKFNLQGSKGSTDITASINEGGLQNMVDVINAQTAVTGITASLNDDNRSITLLDDQNGFITIKDLEIDGYDKPTDSINTFMSFTGIDGNGVPTGKTLKLTDSDQLVSTSVGYLQSAIDNFSLQRAEVGAQISKGQKQSEILGSRKLAVDRDVSKMGDADLAELVTNLQAQITNLNAAQAAFAKIGQQSLFDFLR